MTGNVTQRVSKIARRKLLPGAMLTQRVSMVRGGRERPKARSSFRRTTMFRESMATLI